MDPRVRFQQRVQLARKTGSVAAWFAAENAKGHICTCGCGKPIRILPSTPSLAPVAVGFPATLFAAARGFSWHARGLLSCG